jgi:hypothetical protein
MYIKLFSKKRHRKTEKKKKDSAIINSIRTGVSAKIVFFRENPITFRTSPKIIITLNDSVKLRGLINSNAEINYIDKATYK